MSFAAPWILGLLLLIPALLLVARWRRREQEQIVGSLLIWQRVAQNLIDKPEERKARLDTLMALLLSALAALVLACAQPLVLGAQRTQSPLVLWDSSTARLLPRARGEGMASDALLLKEVESSLAQGALNPPPIDLSRNAPPDPEQLRRSALALANAKPGAQVIVVSPLALGDLPNRIQQVSHEPDPQALPFVVLSSSANLIYAEVTRANSSWQLETLSGEVLETKRARGYQLLLALPAQLSDSEREVLIIRSTERESERAYLLPVLAAHLRGEQVDQRQLEVIAQVFAPRLSLEQSPPLDDARPALALPEFVLRAEVGTIKAEEFETRSCELRELHADLLRDLDETMLDQAWLKLDSESAFAETIRPASFPLSAITHALPEAGWEKVYLSLEGADGRSYPLIAKLRGAPTICSSLGLLSTARKQAWVAPLVQAAYFELCAYSLSEGPRWMTHLVPAPDAQVLERIATTAPTTPAAGLYQQGVINLRGPRASSLLTEERTLPSDWLRSSRAETSLELLFQMLALALLLAASALMLSRLESARKSQ